MLNDRNFTRDELDVLGLPWNLSDVEEVEQRRWYTIRKGVFELENKVYMIYYRDPATEEQSNIDPWDDRDLVLAYEVEKVLVEVERWEPVI